MSVSELIKIDNIHYSYGLAINASGNVVLCKSPKKCACGLLNSNRNRKCYKCKNKL